MVVKKKASAPKKAPSKKRTYDIKASKETAFKTLDGKMLHSILDLAKELDTMSDDVFYHHVADDRNDFYNWINDVLKNEKLAQEIRYAGRNRDKSHLVITKTIIREL